MLASYRKRPFIPLRYADCESVWFEIFYEFVKENQAFEDSYLVFYKWELARNYNLTWFDNILTADWQHDTMNYNTIYSSEISMNCTKSLLKLFVA